MSKTEQTTNKTKRNAPKLNKCSFQGFQGSVLINFATGFDYLAASTANICGATGELPFCYCDSLCPEPQR
eukprot:4434972-Amphidinium_carterae.1